MTPGTTAQMDKTRGSSVLPPGLRWGLRRAYTTVMWRMRSTLASSRSWEMAPS